MASNITFTKKTGTGSSFTLFGNHKAAVDGGGSYVWTRMSASSLSPWQRVTYPGYDGSDAKFMGAKSDRIVIEGYVMDGADIEAVIIGATRTLRQKNNTQATWTVQIGGTDIGTDVGMIIEEVICEALGDGGGPRWPFRLLLTDLGS